MFKKKVIKKKPVRKRADSEDSEPEPDSQTTEQIQMAKKRRKLLTDLQYKRGVDADKLLEKLDDSQVQEDDSNKPSQMPEVEASKEGILQQKQHQAMEAYIQQKIGKGEKNVNESLKDSKPDTSSALTEEELYRQLAESAASLAGKNTATLDAAAATQEADVGSGGAMIAGTGIAEVVLPVNERLKAAQETERARAQKAKSDGGALPSVSSVDSAVPSRFAVPSIQVHPTEEESIREEATKAAAAQAVVTKESNPVDDTRLGFDAIRQRKQQQQSYAGGDKDQKRQKDRASDDRVYKKFLNKQREMREKN